MTFQEMQNEVINFRFKESQRSSVKTWLNLKYAQAWGSDLWPWRIRHSDEASIVSAGDRQGTWPDDLQRAIVLQNPTGEHIDYMTPKQFFLEYPPDDTTTGSVIANYTAMAAPADAATSSNPVPSAPLFGPIPNGPLTLTIAYERRFGHYDSSDNFQLGGMRETGDYPIWPEEHIYVLIMGAMGVGLRMENDDTWPGLEQEFQNGIQQMRVQYLDGDRAVTIQYGEPDW